MSPLFFWRQKTVTDLDGQTPTQVPGLIARRLAPRLAFVVPIGDGAPQLQKNQIIAGVPQASETTVVRLATEARYHLPATWQNIISNPAPAARRWLQNHIPSDQLRKVRNLRGIQLETVTGGGQAVITAKLRIEKSALTSVVSVSGRDSWFIEPIIGSMGMCHVVLLTG